MGAPLAFLLELNLACAAIEASGTPTLPSPKGEGSGVTPPGLPSWIEDREGYVTDDRIRPAPF